MTETPHENNTLDRGPWMLTAQGYKFYPMDPKVTDFRIDEICGTLSKTCRYNGQIPGNKFYSVAEHCTHLADYFLKRNQIDFARWAWAHDGAESIIGDMIRPIKWLFPEFKKIEKNIEQVYFNHFLHLGNDVPDEVMLADTLICNDERTQLWDGVILPSGESVVDLHGYNKREQLGIKVQAWEHREAAFHFKNMYLRLFTNEYVGGFDFRVA